jgi:preprotein translocase subunit SecY
VIPPIFASSIILLPATAVGWFATGEGMRWLKDLSATLSPGQPIYVLLYAAMIVSSASSIPRWCSTAARRRTT